MTVYNTKGTQEQKVGGGAFGQCLNENFLQVVRPLAEKTTEFRPIPEVGSEGNALSMIRMMTPSGPDITNFRIESAMIQSGLQQKFSGLCRASDVQAEKDWDKVFPRIFMSLRSAQKKNAVPPYLASTVEALFKQDFSGKYAKTAFGIPTEYGFVQGIGITVNDVKLEKPKSHQCFILSPSAVHAFAKLCEESYVNGIDLFDPAKGYTVILKGLAPDPKSGRPGWSYIAERGRQIPVHATKYWVPWNQGLKVLPFAEHIKMAVRCYGADIVKHCWPGDYEAVMQPAPVVAWAAVPPPMVQRTPVIQAAPAGPDMSISLDDVAGLETPALPEHEADDDIIASAIRPTPATPGAPAIPAGTATKPPAATSTKDPGAPSSPEDLAKAFEDLMA